MNQTRLSMVKVITRLCIPAGCVALAAALVAVIRVPTLSFRSSGVVGALIAGVILALAGVLFNVRWLWARMTTRRALIMLNVWAQIILCFILLLVANAIAAMTPQVRAWRLDLTHTGRHSISEQTVNLLRSVGQPLRITVIMGDGVARYGSGKDQVVPVAERLAEMLELYEGASGMVATRVIDFDREQAECLKLRNQIEEPLLPNSILFQYENRHKAIPFNLLVKPLSSAEGEAVAYNFEASLTEAVQSVIEKRRATLYVLTGHDEFALEGNSQRAMTAFAAALGKNNYTLKKLNLLRTGKVPDDCQTLIIADAAAPVADEELEAITQYTDAGGNLFILLNPRRSGVPDSGLTAMLGNYNVVLQNARVIWEMHEQTGRIRQRVDPVVFANQFGEHPVTEGLRTLFVRADFASPVTTVEAVARAAKLKPPPGVARYAVTALVLSGQMCWAKPEGVQPAPEDVRGESSAYALAVAVEPRRAHGETVRKGPRIVVSGCANIILDRVFAAPQSMGNRVFAVNAVNWLAHKEYKLGIPPQSSDSRPLTLNNKFIWRIFFLTVIAMPMLVVCVGITVWWRRSRD